MRTRRPKHRGALHSRWPVRATLAITNLISVVVFALMELRRPNAKVGSPPHDPAGDV